MKKNSIFLIIGMAWIILTLSSGNSVFAAENQNTVGITVEGEERSLESTTQSSSSSKNELVPETEPKSSSFLKTGEAFQPMIMAAGVGLLGVVLALYLKKRSRIKK